MNKKIGIFSLAAALVLTGSMEVAACPAPVGERVTVTRRTVTTTSRGPVLQPEAIGERLNTTEFGMAGTPAALYTTPTLSGRRELISNDAVIVQDGGRLRAYWMDGGRMKSLPVRGTLP